LPPNEQRGHQYGHQKTISRHDVGLCEITLRNYSLASLRIAQAQYVWMNTPKLGKLPAKECDYYWYGAYNKAVPNHRAVSAGHKDFSSGD
jgi:hypothetical protein